jgi:acyl-CoA synthetase (NDP forming)
MVGVASYERLGSSDRAEFAVLVADDWHGRGVGTLLLEELVTHARRHGVEEIVGDVLASNSGMLRVLHGLVPDARVRYDAGVMRVSIPTNPDDMALAELELRERTAERHSLRSLLTPATVAVVGAGREPGGVGHEVLRSLIDGGYTGRLYAINPHTTEIARCPAYPKVSALPEPVDLVVVAVPVDALEEVVADAGAAGARTAVVLTAGLAETGPAGREIQERLVRTAREYGMRLVGPNCLGALNTDPRVGLAATFAACAPPPGGLAVASQSGAVGIAILGHAVRTGTGISTFVSLGNKADVSGNDLLAYWCEDPGTRGVALYLESFGNPRKFARLARAVARRKPVLAVKSGRSAGGRRAGLSHTAAAASPDVAVDSLFAQAGVVRTDTLGELLDAARMLVDQPLPAGARVGIVGNAGGVNVLAADAAEGVGLRVPEAPEAGGNPLDLGTGVSSAALGEAITHMAGTGQVDAIVAVFCATRANNPADALAAIARAVDAVPDLPVAVVLIGLDEPPAELGARRAPVYGLPEQAMRALAHAAWYADWRRRPAGVRPALPDIDPTRARSIVDGALADGGGWQPLPLTAELLACYGIPVVPSIVTSGLDATVAAAARFGFPVAVKAADPAIVHKSDLGLVRLDLGSAGEVARAYQGIGAALERKDPPVVVQPMRRNGVELIAGVVHDSLFGSLVMVGAGGVYTDLLADRAFQLLPVTDVDAAELWRRLSSAPLLTGYRGSMPADTTALEDVLARLGRLAEDLPEVAELDLNPLLVFPDGIAAVDAKLRLHPTGPEPDPTRRVLREP